MWGFILIVTAFWVSVGYSINGTGGAVVLGLIGALGALVASSVVRISSDQLDKY